jgi:phage terminase large subunit-like protein
LTAGSLTIVEDDVYRFDEEAAARPCRFIEKFCQHFEGQHAGKPFILHPIQRQIVRDLYGWRHRDTGFRRFSEAWLEGAIGAGKSPLLAGIGLYGLMADGEAGAQVYSLASNYGQARIVFECAKRFVSASDALSRRLDVVDREIRHPATKSVWRIVSGKGPGAGCKPSLILGDEVHQWAGPGAYDDLKGRMAKRQQPLLINATNAGDSRASFCWQLREKAVAALNGTGEASLYPVIWKAADDARTDDEAAWRAANPLLGVTVSIPKVRAACAEAMKDPIEEQQFRRLYMSIWPTSVAGRWLDMADWDACTAASLEAAAPPDGAELYVGMDMALCDDLCAVAMVWATPARFHVAAHFWVPRATAEAYEKQHGVPYAEWAKERHVTLVDEPTISPAVRRKIAGHVVAVSKRWPVKVVNYDRAKVEDTAAHMEAAGLTVRGIAQGYTLSEGAEELKRRLKDRTIVVAPNPVLRWCAENTEAQHDRRGNIILAKPSAKGRYAGTRWKKIDGTIAVVNAMVDAKKCTFPDAGGYQDLPVCLASKPSA